jgi:glucose/arabinose dehydrogenase
MLDQKRLSLVGRLTIAAAAAIVILSGTPTAAVQQEPRRPRSSAVRVPNGYKIEVVVINLSVPTTAIFDGQDLLVAESGWANTARARVLRVTPSGDVRVEAEEGLQAPVTGLLLHQGGLHVSHKGRVSIVRNGRILRDVVSGLPSEGDHQNNNIVMGPDGKIYMGQGTVTNSAVVGVDNYIFGWLPQKRDLYEIPCKTIRLRGLNFESENPLTPQADKVTTGAYKPFGTPGVRGERISGNPKCGGSIVRFNADGSGFELVAWGLRNPFGLEFDGRGQLWATSHGADVRGSRNIFNDPDYLFRVQEGAWYGWPEFYDGEPVTSGRFKAPTKEQPQSLWMDHPPLVRAFARFPTHSGTNGIAISPGGPFGFEGQAFVAQFGAFVPITTGVNVRPSGYNVVRVDLSTGIVHEFASNVAPGPHFVNRLGGFDRPSDVVFGPDGALYVVDWGSSTVDQQGLKLVPQTGVVWRIYPEQVSAVRPQGPVVVAAAPVPEEQRKPEVRNVPEFYRMVGPELALLVIAGLIALILVFLVLRARGRRQVA